MANARFRFYAELNDFLPPQRRGREFDSGFARDATVKHAIEALGVPHTEVELVLVNGRSVDFGHRMRDGDLVSVYPVFEAFDIQPLLRVRPEPLRVLRFIADAHLGALARLLRMLGFDTRYANDWPDDEIRRRARDEHRILLTRDRALLMAADVTHGCYVRAREPRAQLRELVERLQLRARVRPFTLCLECNVPLAAIDKAAVADRVPPRVAALHSVFSVCPSCGRIYWPGGHWQRMHAMLRAALDDDGLPADATGP